MIQKSPVFFIDDEPAVRQANVQTLQLDGYAVHDFAGAAAALTRLRCDWPGVVISDIRMPQMDGFAVLEELRRQPEAAGIPVVVVTGETTLSSDEREQLAELDIVYKTDLQHDYDAFITKVKEQIANYHGDA